MNVIIWVNVIILSCYNCVSYFKGKAPSFSCFVRHGLSFLCYLIRALVSPVYLLGRDGHQ